MREPTEAEIAKYTPRHNWTRELNFGNQWRGVWAKEEELPEGAPVDYAYAVVMRDDKGYVTRRIGDDPWQAVEIEMEVGDEPEAIVRDAVFQQTGAKVSASKLMGFFECKSTKLNSDFEIGTIRVRPLYMVSASEVDDVPDESGYQRRRLPRNQFGEALRKRYPEIAEHMREAVDAYVVGHLRGELP